MNWYKRAQQQFNRCDKVRISLKPQFQDSSFVQKFLDSYFYIDEDDRQYYLSDSCGFHSDKRSSFQYNKNMYDIQKV